MSECRDEAAGRGVAFSLFFVLMEGEVYDEGIGDQNRKVADEDEYPLAFSPLFGPK